MKRLKFLGAWRANFNEEIRENKKKEEEEKDKR